jgi:hypothetical protein
VLQGEIEVQQQGLSLNNLEVGTLCQVAKVSVLLQRRWELVCVYSVSCQCGACGESVFSPYSATPWLAHARTQEKLKFTIGYHEVEGSLTKLKKPVAILKRNFAAPEASVSGAEPVRG